MQVDKRTVRLATVVTDPEREIIRDWCYHKRVTFSSITRQLILERIKADPINNPAP